jgi:adenosylmethionine-8-amino-7-oxononanoate aminotransferase
LSRRDPAWDPAPSSGAGLPKVAWGSGAYVYDSAGRRYLDGSGGPAVFCLGHAHPEVNEAIRRQLDRIAHGYRYSFTSDPLEELEAEISTQAGSTYKTCVFVCGGSEAVESALKIALQYHSARGEPTRRRFISRRRSWHGNTLGALSVSDFKARRDPFEGALVPATFLSAVNPYRLPEGVNEEHLAAHAAQELEQAILRLGPENVAGFIFEPVVGAAGCVIPSPTVYAQRIAEICRRHGVLLIADEVMCGTGRCGTWRALEHDGVEPDIFAIAKGLAGGYVPLGAAVCSDAVAAVLEADGGILTGHTFTGHTLACAAGVAVQRVIRRDGLLHRVAENGVRLMNQLRTQLADCEFVGDVRGRGHFIGIEFVMDRESRHPFPAHDGVSSRIGRAAASRGLLIYPVGGHVDGTAGDGIILAPPFNATQQELELLVELTTGSIRDILQ